MAKQQQSTPDNLNTFIKGLHKDSNPAFIQEGMWTHARNVVNNTAEGDIGTISNEWSNQLCNAAGATMLAPNKYIIGMIHMFSDKWLIFTAGHNGATSITSVMSEIGLFEEESCSYRPIVQDACLNFSKTNLISGASRVVEDCTWQVYWADGLNPDRYINIGDPKLWPSLTDWTWIGPGSNVNYYQSLITPGLTTLWPGVSWKPVPTPPNTCTVTVDDNVLDCDGLRLARLMESPCLNLTIGEGSGALENGSYYAVLAYAIKGEKVTDYFAPSNVQPVYTVDSAQGSLIVEISADTIHFDEFVLVLVANSNENTIAREIGYYSTKTKRIAIDKYPPSLVSVPTNMIGLINPIFEKSDQMTQLNSYLLRIGPTSKFDFNYQPLANLINTEWVAVEYPSDYYFKGGSNTNYVRDEVYPFFIRWLYNTGDKSASYHIPGRAPRQWGPNGVWENGNFSNTDSFPGDTLLFQTINTATQLSNPATVLSDGGVIVGTGEMGYWQSTEKYPDNRPDIYNASYHEWSGKFNQPNLAWDLCGTPIRHHKFPEDIIYDNVTGNISTVTGSNHFRKDPTTGALFIRIMGVRFNNIMLPKDNEGNDIPGIVGYEILRGSREGNKTIIAKGMLNNFRDYERQGVTANTRKGLYANYPYNTIRPLDYSTNPSDHNYLYNDPYIKTVDNNNDVVNQNVPKNIVSFHSPDTSFRNPYLSTGELKIYGHLSGIANQRFIEPQGHPKFKLVTNDALWMILIGGIADALLSSGGQKHINYPQGSFQNWFGSDWKLGGGGSAITGGPYLAFYDGLNITGGFPNQFDQVWNIATQASQTAFNNYASAGGFLADAFSPLNDGMATAATTHNNLSATNGGIFNGGTYTHDLSGYAMMPSWATALTTLLGGSNQMVFYFMEGARAVLDLLYAIGPYRQYALQLLGHGLYDTFTRPAQTDTKRFKVADSFYMFKNTSQEIRNYTNTGTGTTDRYTINNYKRPKLLVLRTERANNNQTDGPKLLTGQDLSLVNLGIADLYNLGPKINDQEKSIEFETPIASHYAALKVDLDDQYGQLRSIVQLPITPCEQNVPSNLPIQVFNVTVPLPNGGTTTHTYNKKVISSTTELFGGDTYVCRFTEKNPMFFFYDWLYGDPNGYEYNYLDSQMIGEPRYWVNSTKYDVSQFQVTNVAAWSSIFNNSNPGVGFFPNSYFNMDNENYDRANDDEGTYPGFQFAKNSYFYLSASGVRDFVVESDVLLDFREVGTFDYEKCYQPYMYTDLDTMFRMDKLTATEGNYYIYDYSLSINRLTNRFTSFGFLQSVYYDPNVAQLCYTYLPNTITYSLPQADSETTDHWFMFLPFNRKDFKSQISAVKTFAKTGALITFKNDSPVVFQGVDTLEMDGSGTKVIIGDGGLFAREPQNIVVADEPYLYGSSQGRLSVISTPAGLYYISQQQGKIFAYGEGLEEINQAGMKWWYDQFLPSSLLASFPEFPYDDNPVAGIGTQAVYDNSNSVLYFSKKDYELKEFDNNGFPLAGRVTYVNNGKISAFLYTPTDASGKLLPPVYLPLGDPLIFNDASWTTSYDPKSKFWISFHDWHPNLTLPTKGSFISIKDNKLYKHNADCNEYCNFYGVQYPFEIEFPITTGQTVTTLKSVEYVLECYRRDSKYCLDQFHILDYNFDELVVYNSEQISGYLNLNIFPKNNVTLSLDYPKLNPGGNSFDILFSKEENKYRINQFWDITKDRGEFPVGSGYPPQGQLIPDTTVLLGNYPENMLWLTDASGYKKVVNPLAVNYDKPELQRKKFRHMVNFMHLSKKDTKNTNMILKLFNTKNQFSYR